MYCNTQFIKKEEKTNLKNKHVTLTAKHPQTYNHVWRPFLNSSFDMYCNKYSFRTECNKLPCQPDNQNFNIACL